MRREKPPGFEKWTWREIDAGHKMSKGEKRMRRAVTSLGAKEKPGGKIEHTPESLAYVIILIICVVGVAALVECSKH